MSFASNLFLEFTIDQLVTVNEKIQIILMKDFRMKLFFLVFVLLLLFVPENVESRRARGRAKSKSKVRYILIQHVDENVTNV